MRQLVVALLLVCGGLLAVAPATGVDAGAGTVGVRLPSGTVAAGARVTITGTAPAPAGRTVSLQSRTTNGWITLGETEAGADGRFRFAAPTWWAARQVLRVYAPKVGDAAAVASTTGTLRVTRRYAPRPGTAYRHLGGVKARWDGCRVVTYRVNPDRMPPGALRDVREAFRRVSEATGLRFSYAGNTSFVPYRPESKSRLTNADLAIAWATPRLVPGLDGPVLGLGGYASVAGDAGWNRIVQGFVLLDSTSRQAAGFGGRRSATRGLLLLHELGHAIGLDHVRDSRQVMYPVLMPQPAQYAAGDLRGLAAVGAGRGCFPTSSHQRPLSRMAAVTYVSAS